MDDGADEITVDDDFRHADLKKKLDDVKRIVDEWTVERRDKQSSVIELLQNCIGMLDAGKAVLERTRMNGRRTSRMADHLMSYEKGVVAVFEHCAESNRVYGDSIVTVQGPLTDLFRKASETQTLVFDILDTARFDFGSTVEPLLNVLRHIRYGAETVYNTSNKVMAANWKTYVAVSQRYSSELKGTLDNDEPVEFLCAAVRKIVATLRPGDETSLKLSTYMTSVLPKLCRYGRVSKSYGTLAEFVLFLNSYRWRPPENAVAVRDRLLPFADQLVLTSSDAEPFAEAFLARCREIGHSPGRLASALRVSTLLLERFAGRPSGRHGRVVVRAVFELIGRSDSVMCCYDDVYEPLLVSVASAILVSDGQLFGDVETTLIKNVLNTDYWPAVFSSDLWIVVMRYLPSDTGDRYFRKLAEAWTALAGLPCFDRCPQHVYLGALLGRHFALVSDKKRLANDVCRQFKSPGLRAAVGIHHVPTLAPHGRWSDLVNVMATLSVQTNTEHLNDDVVRLWRRVDGDCPPEFVCRLIEISLGSADDRLLSEIVPECAKLLSVRADDDTTDTKRCRLRLIRSMLLRASPSAFPATVAVDTVSGYLSDGHPLVRQWAVETAAYVCSVAGGGGGDDGASYVTALFRRPEIRAAVADYLETKTTAFDHDDYVRHFERMSARGRFRHVCGANAATKGGGKSTAVAETLDALERDLDRLRDVAPGMSPAHLDRLEGCAAVLNGVVREARANGPG